MNKKIKIAVCLSGQIRELPSVSEINKSKLDEFSSTFNVDIDYFCHFWNQSGRYPYHIDKNLLDDYLSSIDFINSDTVDVQNRIMRILEPKKIKYSSFNEMTLQIQQLNYTKDKFFSQTSGAYINRSYFNRNLNDFHIWGLLHIDYCNIIKQLAQFYSFEQTVSLVKEYNMESNDSTYDIIVRLRYDALLVDRNLETLAAAIYNAIDKNSMVIGDVRRYSNNGSITYNRQTRVKKNIAIKTTMGEFGIADVFFLGSAPSMIMLAENLFNNASKNYFNNVTVNNPITPEMLWFREIENKVIPCECSTDTALPEIVLIRDHTDLNFEEYGILSSDSLESLRGYKRPVNKHQIFINSDEKYIEILTELFYNMHPVLRPKDQ